MIDHSDSVGWPAKATRVYQDERRILEPLLSAEKRATRREEHIKWKTLNRPAYLAAKRAWYHRWKQKNPGLKSQLGVAL
jgi:hypothetical protein